MEVAGASGPRTDGVAVVRPGFLIVGDGEAILRDAGPRQRVGRDVSGLGAATQEPVHFARGGQALAEK